MPLNGAKYENTPSGPDARSKAMEKDLIAARRGDWEAKHRIERILMPLLTSLARKRASDNTSVNRLIDAGKKGITIAINKSKAGISGDRFQIFALTFIEAAMDKPAGGFLARLFGRRD